MSIFVVADTHSRKIDFRATKEDVLIHCGDWERGEVITDAFRVLVLGNHDIFPTDPWDFVCDGFLYKHIWFTHEPAERLPKGAYFNVCGHIHDGRMNDYGFEEKSWHLLLPPNEIHNLEKLMYERKRWTL